MRRLKDNKNKKIIGISDMMKKLISSSLDSQKQINIFHGIQIYFFIVSQIQITFFLFSIDFQWSLEQNQSIYIDLILIIFRLDLYLSTKEIIKHYSIYVIILLMIVSKISLLVLNQQEEEKKKKNNFYIKKIFSVYIQLFYNFFYIFFSTLIGEFIINQYNQILIADQYYLSFIFGVICFTLLQIEALFHLVVNEQAVEVQIFFFQKTRITIKEYLIFFLNLIVILFYCTIKLSEFTSWIIHVLVLLISTLKIINQQENYVVINQQFKFITYFCNSITIIYIIYFFIQQIIQKFKFNIVAYTSLSFPILLIILIKIDNVLDFNLFYSALNKQKFSLYATSLLLIKKQNNIQLPEILKIYIYLQHMKKCNDSACLCHVKKLLINPKDTAIISVEIDRKFSQYKLKQMRSKLFLNDTKNIDDLQYYTVLYGVLLANNGWIVQAIKHFNQLLFGRENSKSSNQSVNISIQGVNSFSNTIKNDSSSQTITNTDKKFEDAKMSNQRKQQKNILTFSLSLDMVQKEKVIFLLNEIKIQLRNAFGNQILTEEQHDLSEHIQAFIEQEFKMEQHLKQIKKLLSLKIKYFENLQQQIKENKVNDQFKSVLRICQNLLQFKNTISYEYQNYPSKRLLALQIFFENEVFTNCSEAYKLHNQATISDDNVKMKNLNYDVNFYSTKLSHILVSVEDDLQYVELKSFSNNLKEMLGYNLNDELTFHKLFLPFIAREHPLLISRFFKIGKSKYYKQFNETFIQYRKGYAKSVIFSFDNVVQKQFDKIALVGLFQEIQIQQAYVLVDVNHIVGGITYSFLQFLGYNSNFIDNIDDFNIFYNLKIKQIFPDFEDYIVNQEQEQQIKIYNVETHFLNLEIYFEEFQNQNLISIKQQADLLNQLWNTENFLINYQSNITIFVHELYGYYYYIIQIDSLVQFQCAKKVNTVGQQNNSLNKNDQSESFEFSQLNLSIEEAIPRTINQFTIRSRDGYTQINLKSQQNVNLFAVQEIEQDEILLKIDQMQLMFSPNKSTSQLIEKQQNKLLQSSQQDYFTNNTSQKRIKQYQSIDNNNLQVKEDIRKNIDSKLTTEFSSNNEFLKKYELLETLTKIKTPKTLKILLFFIFLLIIIEGIYPLQTILILNNDIFQFISDIEIISLHASIQGPHDLFFSMRNTITAYQQMAREGFLTTNFAKNLTEPYYLNVGLGYKELRDSFYKQLDNEYLKYFLDEEYMQLRFMKENDTQIYSLPEKTFRECLLIILQYQFAQMRTFEKRQSTAGQPYQVFLFANYYNIQDKLENITNSILLFSKNRSLEVSSKWAMVSIIFSLLVALIIVILIVHYHFYLQLYDKFIQILSYVDKNIIQVEIEKINQLLGILNSNQSYVYSYKFDLKLQQQKLENYAILDKIQKNKKNLEDQDKIKLPRRYVYLFWIIIIAIFQIFVLITSLKTNEYLGKYDETADFYFMIQNLKFRSGSVFMYKEHFFRWKNFTYLTDYELGRLYSFVDKALVNIQDYLEFTNTFQPDKYLISDKFVTFFRNQQTMNLCELIDQVYLDWMQLYCEKAFQGQIKKGSIAVLNYMSNSIKQQQAINNFTKRVEVELYELEGAQIVLRAFFKISDEFQSGLKQITIQENYFILVLTILFASYLILFLLIVLLYFKRHYTIEYATVRLLVYLIPQQILLGDESYERYLKRLVSTQNLK